MANKKTTQRILEQPYHNAGIGFISNFMEATPIAELDAKIAHYIETLSGRLHRTTRKQCEDGLKLYMTVRNERAAAATLAGEQK
jgi:hypothetical protein